MRSSDILDVIVTRLYRRGQSSAQGGIDQTRCTGVEGAEHGRERMHEPCGGREASATLAWLECTPVKPACAGPEPLHHYAQPRAWVCCKSPQHWSPVTSCAITR